MGKTDIIGTKEMMMLGLVIWQNPEIFALGSLSS